VQQRRVNAAERAKAGPLVGDAADTREPPVGGRVVRDEEQLVGGGAQRRGHSVHDALPSHRGQSLRLRAEA
jgi:hypothetical protein